MSQAFTSRPPDDPARRQPGVPASRGFRGRLAISLAAMLFYGSFLCAVSAALWAAEQIVLRLVYGPVAVHWEQLRLVKVKPVLVVSNGDRLDGWGFPFFLITTAIWVPLFFGLMATVWRWLPADYRRRIPLSSGDSPFAGASPVDALFVIASFLLTVGLILGVGMGTAGVTLLAAALVTAWLTAEGRDIADTAPPAGGPRP